MAQTAEVGSFMATFSNFHIWQVFPSDLDLEKGEYGPFRKPEDNPIYVSRESNHPQKVLENIPTGINKRLSRISCTEEIFNQAAPDYQDALERSGYKCKLNYQPEEIANESSVPKRKRCRKIIYFNPSQKM